MGGAALGQGGVVIVVTVARRPLAGSVAASVLDGGAGALNIDAARVAAAPGDETTSHVQGKVAANTRHTLHRAWQGIEENYQTDGQKRGRWPANLVLEHRETCAQEGCADGCPVADLDAQSGTTTAGAAGKMGSSGFVAGYDGGYDVPYGDTGGAGRYFKQVGVAR